jgi:hypothetical protein
MAVPTEIDRRVRSRAKGLCEYCRLPQAAYPWRFQIDHIVAEQHRGRAQMSNLALACPRCNRSKGPHLSGIDTRTRRLTPLFHPRRDRWTDHFRWRGPRLIGLTPVGRVTVSVLNINHPDAIKLRRSLIVEGLFPPGE